jgi:hypothetical protein
MAECWVARPEPAKGVVPATASRPLSAVPVKEFSEKLQLLRFNGHNPRGKFM